MHSLNHEFSQVNSKQIRQYRIELPFPVSNNNLWLRGRRIAGRWPLSRPYRDWIDEANGMWLQQKLSVRPVTLGVYRSHMIFSSDCRRANQDGENLIKCVSDYLQRIEIIENDCLAVAGSWQWGNVDGCVVEVEGECSTGVKSVRYFGF